MIQEWLVMGKIFHQVEAALRNLKPEASFWTGGIIWQMRGMRTLHGRQGHRAWLRLAEEEQHACREVSPSGQ